MSASDFGHSESDEHGEERDDDPSDGHDGRAAGVQAILEKRGDTGLLMPVQ